MAGNLETTEVTRRKRLKNQCTNDSKQRLAAQALHIAEETVALKSLQERGSKAGAN